MKRKITYIIFTALITLSSCQSIKRTTNNKKTDSTKKTQESTLIGRWKLVKLSGGIIGKEQDPPMGQAIVLEFTPTEIITIINGKETSRTTYILGKGKSIHNSEQVPMIYTNGNMSMGQSYHLQENKLGISEEFNDGFYYSYIKINSEDDGLLRE